MLLIIAELHPHLSSPSFHTAELFSPDAMTVVQQSVVLALVKHAPSAESAEA
jgi:hypothetical protein